MWTWGQALAWGISELGQDKKVDVLRLLTDNTNYNLLAVYDLSDQPCPHYQSFQKSVKRRLGGEPVAYITNRQDFWDYSFFVDQRVLIPRQDSELMVDTMLKFKANSVLELGVGSGAVIISYLLSAKTSQGFASDISSSALEVAKINSKNLNCNLEFRQGSWLQPWQDMKFDMIVANPPYIASNDGALNELKFEPQNALVADNNGLSDLQAIIEQAPLYLNSCGWLLLEHGFDQANTVRSMLKDWRLSYSLQDINGKDRLTLAQAH